MYWRTVVVACLATIFALPSVAIAQGARGYPSKPVRMIAPAAPGGNPDVLARMLAQKLSDEFGKSFVVENMPGGGGVTGAVTVVQSPPDGHTLFLADAGALAILPALNPKLPYHPLKDLTFITALAAVPTVLVLHPSVPASTLQEFISLAKAKPGQLNFGSAGNGSIHHLTMAMFTTSTGIELVHVPFKGGTPLVAALLAGDVHAGFSGIPNVIQPIKTGRLRALGISTARRSSSLPDVPTLAEQGIKGFDVATTIGLQAPAGTPREIVARLQQAAAKAVRERDVAERIASLGMEVMENGTEHYVRLVKDDYERYGAAVKAAGIKLE